MKLQKLMWSYVGVIRKEDELLEAIKTIKEIRRRKRKLSSRSRRFNREWIEAMTLHNMLDMGEMMARSALMRTESRGAHYREEYPERDDNNWLKNVVVKNRDGTMSLEAVPVAFTKIRPEEVG
jgi:succinate dehydrogenase/fumarate reductase flavoprotein subunit